MNIAYAVLIKINPPTVAVTVLSLARFGSQSAIDPRLPTFSAHQSIALYRILAAAFYRLGTYIHCTLYCNNPSPWPSLRILISRASWPRLVRHHKPVMEPRPQTDRAHQLPKGHRRQPRPRRRPHLLAHTQHHLAALSQRRINLRPQASWALLLPALPCPLPPPAAMST